MVAQPSCPLLEHPARSISRIGGFDAFAVDCPVCGRFSFTGTLGASLKSFPEEIRRAVSWFTRERAERSEPIPELTSVNLEEIAKSMSELSVLEKADRLLRAYAARSLHPGSPISFEDPDEFTSLVRARSRDELKYLTNHLVEAKLVDRRADGKLVVSVTGWRQLQRERELRLASRRAFVAMWFDSSLDAAYEAGIRQALEDVHLEAIRIDRVHHNEKICDKILAEVRDCGVVIADFTGHRQGVYFEAGFALGLGKPVIWCCREKDLDEAHFDTRQYNHIVWSTPEDLREKLRERLRATVLPLLPGNQA
jgi:nucleoside 2-deoxyribosyltransferase